MKKFLAILLCLVMVLGCLVGCAKTETKQEEPKKDEPKKEETKKEEPKKEESKKEDTQQQEEKKDETPAWVPGQLPLVQPGEDNVVTVGIMQHAMIEDYETNATTLWIEEQTGLDLQFVYFSADKGEAKTQLNAMIAANEKLPDILTYFTAVSDSLRYELGEGGYFLDLTDYINDLGYWFWDAYDQLDPQAQLDLFAIGKDPSNGAFYGYPSYQVAEGTDAVNTGVMVNQLWLDKVGMKAPTTIDELYDLLVAFKEGGDLNGDGIENDIPMFGEYAGNRADITEWIINAYIFCCDQNFFNVTDGEFWVPYTTDEYREALKFLYKLYDEDLLSPLTFSIANTSEVKAITTPPEGSSLCGIFASHPVNGLDPANENTRNFVALAPLQDYTGKGGWAPLTGDTFEYKSFITADAKNPELCFKLLDFMACKESVNRMRNGVLGVDWEWAPEGSTTANGTPASARIINNVWRTQNNVCWNMIHASIRPLGFLNSMYEDDGSTTAYRSLISKNIYNYYLDGKQPEQICGYYIMYNTDEQEVVSDLKSGVTDYVDEARALFVSGVMDPNSDADWQTYLDNLNTLGLNDFMAVTQSAWERMNG